MQKNYQKVISILNEKNIDAVLVSDGYNMRYISGFTGATGYLFISKDTKKLFTDSRYTVAAKAQAPDFEVVIVDSARNYVELINRAIAECNVKSLAFEANDITFAAYKKLHDSLNIKDFIPFTNELTALRTVKTEEEIAALREAEHIGDIAFSEILSYIKPGTTELQIAAKLEYIMKCNGAENLSFDTIVAAGENGSKPHAEPGEYKIQEGDLVTMDYGAIYKGYHSDMTRTVCVGRASKEKKDIYNTVLKAQCAVIDRLASGRPGKEYDAIARDIIREAGYGDYFGHGLGHSVGLEIHEDPRFSPVEERIILPGTIMTVEPGIYISGLGGVRIEDMLLIKEDGYENFTHSAKELIEL